MEEEQKGEARAEYGAQIIAQLAEQLTHQYGKGFSARYLRSFRKFYLITGDFQIWKSRFPNLTWTHIYKSFLPTEEQLRTEIERQKQLFMMQHEENNKEGK